MANLSIGAAFCLYFFHNCLYISRMKIFLLLVVLFCFSACAQPSVSNQPRPQPAIPKTEIEAAIRTFIETNQTKRPIEGFAYTKYNDSLYLVGVKFQGVEGRALNVVARKYDDLGWKAENYSEEWRSILRLEPDPISSR